MGKRANSATDAGGGAWGGSAAYAAHMPGGHQECALRTERSMRARKARAKTRASSVA